MNILIIGFLLSMVASLVLVYTIREKTIFILSRRVAEVAAARVFESEITAQHKTSMAIISENPVMTFYIMESYRGDTGEFLFAFRRRNSVIAFQQLFNPRTVIAKYDSSGRFLWSE